MTELRLSAAIRAARASFRQAANGMALPIPGASELARPITVMATPPTITAGASGAASAITGAQTIYFNNVVVGFRYIGTRYGQGSGFPNSDYASPQFIADESNPAATLHSVGSWGVEFEHYGQQVELLVKGTGGRYRLNVLGEGVDALDGRADYTADGTLRKVLYAFGSVAWRRMRWEFSGTVAFGGFTIGPNDTILNPSWPKGPRVVVIGDSFTEPTNAFGYRGFVHAMGEARGWHDLVPSGSGSTGYLRTNAPRVKFRDRAQRDIIDAAPDVVIVAGGINDQGQFTQQAIQDEADALFAMIRSGLPSAKLIVVGPFWPSGSPVAALIQTRDAIRTAALASGRAHLFIDPIGGTVPYDGNAANYVDTGWMTGTGRVGATTGTGNADLFTSSDTTHPTQAGHDYLGRQIAAAISGGLPL